MRKILIIMLAVIFSTGTAYAGSQQKDLNEARKKLLEKSRQAFKHLKKDKKKHVKKYEKKHSVKDKKKHMKKDKKNHVKKHSRKGKRKHHKKKKLSREKRCEIFKRKKNFERYQRFQCEDFEPKEFCGDGVVNNQEQCEGVSVVSCQLDGYAGYKDCQSDCTYSACTQTEFCGDSAINANEQCDDGNNVDGDGCNSVCEVEGCFVVDYKAVQITDNSSDDNLPMINNNGTIVWSAKMPDNYRQIFYNNDLGSTQLTAGNLWNSNPQINDNGTIVWATTGGASAQVKMYDGTIKTVSENRIGRYPPQLNNNDQVVWTGRDPNGSQPSGDIDSVELFYFDGFSVTQVTDNFCNDAAPKLNDSGEVVWFAPTNPQEGCSGTSSLEIFKYDGVVEDQITLNDSMDYEVDINNKGQVMYINVALDGVESLIMLDDISKLKILEGQIQAFGAIYDRYTSYAFNSVGHMAWYGSSLLGIGIHYYNGTETVLVDSGERVVGTIQLNDNDMIVWSESDGAQDWEIMFYSRGSVIQLTNNNFDDLYPEINNANEIVWQSNDGNDTEIVKATPVCK